MEGGVFASVFNQPSRVHDVTSATNPQAHAVYLFFTSTPHLFTRTFPTIPLHRPTSSTMTPFNGTQDDKKTASTELSMDTGILVPPQEEKSSPVQPTKRDLSWLLPPQEEMIDVARARGEKGESLRSTVD